MLHSDSLFIVDNDATALNTYLSAKINKVANHKNRSPESKRTRNERGAHFDANRFHYSLISLLVISEFSLLDVYVFRCMHLISAYIVVISSVLSTIVFYYALIRI